MVNPPYRIQTTLCTNQSFVDILYFVIAIAIFLGNPSSVIAQEQEISVEIPDTSASPEKPKDAPPSVSSPTALRIVDNYLNALGGVDAIGLTQNIVIRTEEISGQKQFETLVFRTASGSARVERVGLYSGRPSEFHWVSDGEQFWSVNFYRGREIVQWFSDEEMGAFLFKHSLYPHLYRHRENEVKLRYLGIEMKDEEEFYLVKAYFPNGTRIEYLFDQQTFLPHLYRFKNKYNGDTGYRIIKPTKYKRINGALWLTDYTIHFGELELPIGRFTSDRAEGNQPIPASLFYAPEKIKLEGALPDNG